MEQPSQAGQRRGRPATLCVEPLEDRVVLAPVGLPISLPGTRPQALPLLAAARSAEFSTYPTVSSAHNPDGVGTRPNAEGGREAEGQFDRWQDEARRPALDAVISAYLAADRAAIRETDEAHRAAGLRDRNGPSPSAPAAASGAPPPPAAQGSAERPTTLALLPRESNRVGLACEAPARPAPEQPAGSSGAADVPAPAPLAVRIPTTDLICTADLPLDALQFDLSAVQRAVDEFFARLAELGLPGGGGVTFPLVPAVIVVAALAYDCGRRWGRRGVVSAICSEDFIVDLSVEEP